MWRNSEHSASEGFFPKLAKRQRDESVSQFRARYIDRLCDDEVMRVAKLDMNGKMRTRAGGLAVTAALMLGSAVGCGDSGPELIPVVGIVTLDGQKATEGAVTFRHASTGAFEASGLIQPDGTYKLMRNNAEGAQAGKYRVVVFVRKTPMTPSGEIAGLPSIIVNQKFTNPSTTPLSVEVTKDAPAGHYDLAVTR